MATHKLALDTQKCKKCKASYPLNSTYFHINSRRKSGYSICCKNCAKENRFQWEQNNKEKHNIQQKKSKLKRLNNGQCINCTNLIMENSNRVCEEHYFKQLAKNHLKDGKRWEELVTKLKNQNYRCRYTNEELILGINDSIDHIKPTSKYPELSTDIDNLQWITRQVNFMKSNITEDRFIELATKIANYKKQQ